MYSRHNSMAKGFCGLMVSMTGLQPSLGSQLLGEKRQQWSQTPAQATGSSEPRKSLPRVPCTPVCPTAPLSLWELRRGEMEERLNTLWVGWWQGETSVHTWTNGSSLKSWALSWSWFTHHRVYRLCLGSQLRVTAMSWRFSSVHRSLLLPGLINDLTTLNAQQGTEVAKGSWPLTSCDPQMSSLVAPLPWVDIENTANSVQLPFRSHHSITVGLPADGRCEVGTWGVWFFHSASDYS